MYIWLYPVDCGPAGSWNPLPKLKALDPPPCPSSHPTPENGRPERFRSDSPLVFGFLTGDTRGTGQSRVPDVYDCTLLDTHRYTYMYSAVRAQV